MTRAANVVLAGSWWDEATTRASLAWDQTRQAVDEAFEDRIERAESRFKGIVQDFLDVMKAWRADLDRQQALLGEPGATEADREAYEAGNRAYLLLANRFATEAKPADEGSAPVVDDEEEDEYGAPPVALIVGGLAVTAAGVAAATVGYQYAVAGRERTALELAELQARVEMNRQGQQLQPSTLGPPSNPANPLTGDGSGGSSQGGFGIVLAAGALVTVGVLAVASKVGRVF